ncbi:hypothetical protein BDD12DRAFT_191098 [Trichophaea hybrida]|nr:hypothetical protein BDD12DRAFT_191098 [Trichophaea hybrida]
MKQVVHVVVLSPKALLLVAARHLDIPHTISTSPTYLLHPIVDRERQFDCPLRSTELLFPYSILHDRHYSIHPSQIRSYRECLRAPEASRQAIAAGQQQTGRYRSWWGVKLLQCRAGLGLGAGLKMPPHIHM